MRQIDYEEGEMEVGEHLVSWVDEDENLVSDVIIEDLTDTWPTDGGGLVVTKKFFPYLIDAVSRYSRGIEIRPTGIH